MSNVATVQGIYEAFGRGDIPAILERLADDVLWDNWPSGNGAQQRGVPWMLERHGRDQVPAFFQVVQESLEFHTFEPRAILEGDGKVAALIFIDITVTATSTRFQDEEIHLWTFGDDGQVTEFRHYVDTARQIMVSGVGA